MTDEVVIICPGLTPGAGGVADYTLRLVEQWRGTAELRFLVPISGESAAQVREYSVQQIENHAEALRKTLPSHGGKVLLQYSAYGFHRFGYPRWLLRGLVDWRRRSAGLLAIMFHEIWAFWPVLNKNYLLQQLHRRDIGKLLSRADAVFTSTASQAEYLRALCPERAVQILPVGSNINPISHGDRARPAGLVVLFGLQGSRVRALEKMQSDLSSLAAAKKITKLVTVGAGKAADGDENERRLLAPLQLAEGFEQRGALSEADISALLSSASFGISTQDALSFSKSGTFMAYAAHGLNILSPYAGASQPEPLCWLTHPNELLQGIPAALLTSRAENLRAWQQRTSSWPRIADQFARALQLVATSPAGRAGVGAE